MGSVVLHELISPDDKSQFIVQIAVQTNDSVFNFDVGDSWGTSRSNGAEVSDNATMLLKVMIDRGAPKSF